MLTNAQLAYVAREVRAMFDAGVGGIPMLGGWWPHRLDEIVADALEVQEPEDDEIVVDLGGPVLPDPNAGWTRPELRITTDPAQYSELLADGEGNIVVSYPGDQRLRIRISQNELQVGDVVRSFADVGLQLVGYVSAVRDGDAGLAHFVVTTLERDEDEYDDEGGCDCGCNCDD